MALPPYDLYDVRSLLTEEERARVLACADPATLERWVENVLGAKTAADVLS